MSVNLHLYKHFIALAEELHYGRAAERLHIVQPALTRSIHVLEEEIGVSLIERTSRRVALTPAGAAFLVSARGAVAQFEEAIHSARRVGSGEGARLRIGFGSAAMFRIFPDALKLFYERHREAECLVTEGVPEQLLIALGNHQMDLVVIHKEYVPGPPVQSRPLYSTGLVAVVPADWPVAQRTKIHLHDLKDYPFIFFPAEASPMNYTVIMSVANRCGLNPKISLYAQGVTAMLSLVSNGLGYTLLNEGIRDWSMPDVVYLDIANPEAQGIFDLELCWRSDNPSKPLMNFLRAVDEVCGKGLDAEKPRPV